MAKVLRNLRIDEVSTVDKGAGEGVRVTLWKRDGEPSKNPGKTKAHIRSRARALGLTSQLSDAFKMHKLGPTEEENASVIAGYDRPQPNAFGGNDQDSLNTADAVWADDPGPEDDLNKAWIFGANKMRKQDEDTFSPDPASQGAADAFNPEREPATDTEVMEAFGGTGDPDPYTEAYDYESGSGRTSLMTSNPRLDKGMAGWFAKMFGVKPRAVLDQTAVAKATQMLAASVNSILKDGNADKPAMLAETFAQFNAHVSKLASSKAAAHPTARRSPMSAIVAKALGLDDKATEQDVLKALATMQDAVEKAKAKFTPDEEKEDEKEKDAKKRAEFRAMTHEQRREYMTKKYRTDLPESVRKRLEHAEQIEKRLAALEGERALASFNKMAVDAGLPEAEGTTLMKAYGDGSNKEAFEKMVAAIKAANAAAIAAGAFNEIGTTLGSASTGKAYDELMAKAEEMRKADPKLTQAKAFEKIYSDPANAKLVQRERAENRPN